jgi:hypothetical protein
MDLGCSEKREIMSTGPEVIRVLTVDDHYHREEIATDSIRAEAGLLVKEEYQSPRISSVNARRRTRGSRTNLL